MPPTRDSNEQLDEYGRRLDEHGVQLNQYGERLNIHAARFDRLQLIIEGDEKAGVRGLVGMMKDTSEVLASLVEWRHEWEITFKVIRIAAIVGLTLLGVIAVGVWRVPLEVVLKLLGGIP